MTLATKIYVSESNNFSCADEFQGVCTGTIIHITDVGYYMFSILNDEQLGLISLVDGNRWDDPLEVDRQAYYPIDVIRQLVGDDFQFKIVKEAHFSF